MTIVPIGLKAANEYVSAYHRHQKPIRGCKFCVSVEDEDGGCCGVAICGRPFNYFVNNFTIEYYLVYLSLAVEIRQITFGHFSQILTLSG